MNAFNLWMFLCALAVCGWIATYKPAGSNAHFRQWFAAHLWRKERE